MSSTNLSSHTGRHNKQFFSQCSGERQNIFEKLQYHPAPHTPNGNIHPHIIIHSLFFPISPFTLFHFLGNFSDFLDTSFSWTLSFPQGPYFSSFFSGDRSLYLFHLPQFVGLHPTDTTRLISGRACLGVSTIKSAALLFPPPRVNLLVPVPAATYNTCSAYN